jgi:hypothetical protein
MERAFGTLQGRLPQDMRLARINDIETGNAWLRDVYIAQHNARLSVAAEEDGSAFIPFLGDLANILCIHEERVVSKDNTVRYEGRILQIPEHTHRRHFVKASVRGQEYPDGRLAIFQGPRLLASYEVMPAPKTHPGEKSETSAA